MKTLFSEEVACELIARLKMITPEHRQLWGKMNAAQMMAHCSIAMEVARDRKQLKRMRIGYVLGGLLKKNFYNEKHFARNSPTHPYYIKAGDAEIEKERVELIAHLRAFQAGGPEKCTTQQHTFFGRLTPEQWGIGMYKHADHHLRQFGV